MTDTKSLILNAERGDYEARRRLVERVYPELEKLISKANQLQDHPSLLNSEVLSYLATSKPKLKSSATIEEVLLAFKRKIYDRYVDRIER